MKNFIFLCILILALQSCYIYRPYEPLPSEQMPSFREQLKPNQKYEVSTANENFKIQMLEWQRDSLLVLRNKRDTVKLAENQITAVKHSVFSRNRSDALTFATYGAIGVLIYFLIK